jgi:hypothetical protein
MDKLFYPHHFIIALYTKIKRALLFLTADAARGTRTTPFGAGISCKCRSGKYKFMYVKMFIFRSTHARNAAEDKTR